MLGVVAIPRSLSTSCSVCSEGCGIRTSLEAWKDVVYTRSCETNQRLKVSSSSIRVASNYNDGDQFTVTTAINVDNYNKMVAIHKTSYNYFGDLSSGPYRNGRAKTTCFSSTGTHTFPENTVLYIVIFCINYVLPCDLSIGIDYECLGLCDTVSCGFHSKCISGKCVCDVDYTGNSCEILVDICANISCGTHGKCVSGECVCDVDYTGNTCETVVDKCDGILQGCGSYGVCKHGVCFCSSGYGGDRCQHFDKCHNISCGSHGTCDDGVCLCRAGYYGDKCQHLSSCPDIPCGSHGTCKDGVCFCSPGYGGNKCQYTNNCLGISCGPHGTCNDKVCFCIPGYGGESCNILIPATVFLVVLTVHVKMDNVSALLITMDENVNILISAMAFLVVVMAHAVTESIIAFLSTAKAIAKNTETSNSGSKRNTASSSSVLVDLMSFVIRLLLIVRLLVKTEMSNKSLCASFFQKCQTPL